jgi:hypothetical protein
VTGIRVTSAITETITSVAIAATREITNFVPIVITTVQILFTRPTVLLPIAVATFVTVTHVITEAITVCLLDICKSFRLDNHKLPIESHAYSIRKERTGYFPFNLPVQANGADGFKVALIRICDKLTGLDDT